MEAPSEQDFYFAPNDRMTGKIIMMDKKVLWDPNYGTGLVFNYIKFSLRQNVRERESIHKNLHWFWLVSNQDFQHRKLVSYSQATKQSWIMIQRPFKYCAHILPMTLCIRTPS
jgi:hypothetical protein